MEKPDYSYWLNHQLWTLIEASCLLFGDNPVEPAKFDKNTESGNVSALIYKDLKDAIDLNQLKFIKSRDGTLQGRRVKPVEAIEWANSRGYITDGLSKLTSLLHLTEKSDTTDSAFITAFDETVWNDRPIEWRYWLHQMPTLTAEQAARLICGLDPDIFKNLDNRPNNNDPTRACNKARKIQRLAETQGIEKAKPKDWLQWADKHTFKVHDGFRHEVNTIDEMPLPSTLNNEPPRPLPQQRHQEQEILRIIRKLGYEPLELPKNKKGKSGVKAEVRAKLNLSTTIFNKAWERLRASSEIQYAS